MVSDTFISSSVKTTNSMPIMKGSHDLRSEDEYRGRKIKSHSHNHASARNGAWMAGHDSGGGVGNGAD